GAGVHAASPRRLPVSRGVGPHLGGWRVDRYRRRPRPLRRPVHAGAVGADLMCLVCDATCDVASHPRHPNPCPDLATPCRIDDPLLTGPLSVVPTSPAYPSHPRATSPAVALQGALLPRRRDRQAFPGRQTPCLPVRVKP